MALSKKHQKIPKKNINSLNRNKPKEKRIPSWILEVWFPARPSITTVLVHKITVLTKDRTQNNKPKKTPYFRNTIKEEHSAATCTETQHG